MATILELLNQAIAFFRAGHYEQADAIYRQVLTDGPGHADALHLRGLLLEQVGQIEQAEAHIRRAIEIFPQSQIFHYNLGHFLCRRGRNLEALPFYQNAVTLNPQWAEAHCSLGNVLRLASRSIEAESHYRSAIAINPNLVEAFNNLGNMYRELSKFQQAIDCYLKADAIAPNMAEIVHNIGMTHSDLGNVPEGLAALRKSIELNPSMAKAYINLGSVLHDLGRDDEALPLFEKAFELAPDFPPARWNYSLECLKRGNYERGWREYESRLDAAGMVFRPNIPKLNVWNGQSDPNATLLVYSEQGIGDLIQFCRFLPRLKGMVKKVVLQCQGHMLPMLKRHGLADEFVYTEQNPPATHFQIALGSLPRIFKINASNASDARPYLFADEERKAKWKSKLEKILHPRVGLCWAGNPANRNDRFRSFHPRRLLPLAEIPNLSLISLQKECLVPLPDEWKGKMHDWTSELNDFEDTAAMISNLDLVISVDTAVAHISGALGKPVWLLNAMVTDWRWGKDRDDSPWYPTLKVFRQKVYSDWDEVIARVAKALKSFTFEFTA